MGDRDRRRGDHRLRIEGVPILPWFDALSGVVIRHHDPLVEVVLVLLAGDPPQLALHVENTIETTKHDGTRLARLNVATTSLAWWPGARLFRTWLAVAWAGYIQHEALELVMADGVRLYDPHVPIASGHRLSPYAHDRGLRDGFPPELTRDTMLRALCTAMDREVAEQLMA